MDGRFGLVEVMRALRVYINAPSLHAFPICEVGYRLMSKTGDFLRQYERGYEHAQSLTGVTASHIVQALCLTE